jgi:drug/metabolite transporter (DMT)-like permease
LPLKSWFKFIYLGLVWGSTFLWLELGLEEFGPITLNAMRLAVAALGLWILVRITHTPFPSRQDWGKLFFLGIVNIAFPFVLITWSQQSITSGLASILNSTSPLFTVLLALAFVPEDRLTSPRIIGLVCGFAGVVVLMAGQVGSVEGNSLWGQGGVLLASIAYAVAIIYARRNTAGIKPLTVAFGQSLVANLVLWPLALWFESPLVVPTKLVTWSTIFWLGILATCIGTALYYALLNEVGPTRTTMVTYLFPLVGVLLGWIILDEPLSWRLLAGGAMIVSGVALVNLSPAKPPLLSTERND